MDRRLLPSQALLGQRPPRSAPPVGQPAAEATPDNSAMMAQMGTQGPARQAPLPPTLRMAARIAPPALGSTTPPSSSAISGASSGGSSTDPIQAAAGALMAGSGETPLPEIEALVDAKEKAHRDAVAEVQAQVGIRVEDAVAVATLVGALGPALTVALGVAAGFLATLGPPGWAAAAAMAVTAAAVGLVVAALAKQPGAVGDALEVGATDLAGTPSRPVPLGPLFAQATDLLRTPTEVTAGCSDLDGAVGVLQSHVKQLDAFDADLAGAIGAYTSARDQAAARRDVRSAALSTALTNYSTGAPTQLKTITDFAGGLQGGATLDSAAASEGVAGFAGSASTTADQVIGGFGGVFGSIDQAIAALGELRKRIPAVKTQFQAKLDGMTGEGSYDVGGQPSTGTEGESFQGGPFGESGDPRETSHWKPD